MQQLLLFSNECKQAHLFPKLISRSNIYVNTQNLHVKLIIPKSTLPFKKSIFFTNLRCSTYYLPPEWIKNKHYFADSLLTWNMGLLLFFMFYNKMPFQTKWEIVHAPVILKSDINISLEVNLLIGWCLAKRRTKRITLNQIIHHPWVTQNYI